MWGSIWNYKQYLDDRFLTYEPRRSRIFQIFEGNTELQTAASGKIVSDDVKW
jgi:hypothetical protein